MSILGDAYNVYIERMFDGGWGGTFNNVNSMYLTGFIGNTLDHVYVGVGNGVACRIEDGGSYSRGNIITNCRFDNSQDTALILG